jgi:hypothetical protein
MAGHYSLNSRLCRLESRIIRMSTIPPTKQERDYLVRRYLNEGDPTVLLSGVSEPHCRAAIEAAFRADH